MIRTFGSRRHYSFNSMDYRKEVKIIVEELAKRYGNKENLIGWQVDNELGCHDQTRSYNVLIDEIEFHKWLKNKYGNDINNLNAAYGNHFWSMDYDSFDEINLPNLCVTSANPSIEYDFYKFSSSSVKSFLDEQVEILQKYSSPNIFITTNYMGFFNEFDHHDVSTNINLITWDVYPLGDLSTNELYNMNDIKKYFVTGHPDYIGFNDDLYYNMKKKGVMIMEHQPGPVNWGNYNPSPPESMIRTWVYHHFSHNVDVVNFFRWRRSRFAQEQMHHGLMKIDFSKDMAYYQVKKVLEEVNTVLKPYLNNTEPTQSKIAIVYDYETSWTIEILPNSVNFSYLRLVFSFYEALSKFGINVDVISTNDEVEDLYDVVVIPSLTIVDEEFIKKLNSYSGMVVLGPRSGSLENDYSIPLDLAPGKLQKYLNLKVIKAETFTKERYEYNNVVFNGREYEFDFWKEEIEIETDAISVLAKFKDNNLPAISRDGNFYYFSFFPTKEILIDFFMKEFDMFNNFTVLPDGIRIRERGCLKICVNYNSYKVDISKFIGEGKILIGTHSIDPYGVTIWKV